MSEHILRVTRASDDEHDAEYGMVCQSADPKKCMVWWECQKCDELTGEAHIDLEERLCEDGETVIHGIAHKSLGGMICHEGEGCVTRYMEVEYDFDPEELPVGDHQVAYECEESWVYITLLEVSS